MDNTSLIKETKEIFEKNQKNRIWYGRCIFLSWYCGRGDCRFCYRSTQKHKIRHPATAKRSMGSVLIEALLCKKLNWRIEFLTGGYEIMPFDMLLDYAKNISIVYGDKLWINLGVLPKEELEQLKPYVKGIVSSIETCTPKLHDYVCPSKPIQPYADMFKTLDKDFKKSIAIIIGLGDKREDIIHLFNFIQENNLDRITVYELKPIPGLEFKEGPTKEEVLWWLANIRKQFPKLQIIVGTNLRRCEEVPEFIEAGANAVTKFPATKAFGTQKAKDMVKGIRAIPREFSSELVTLPKDIDWHKEIDELSISQEYKEQMHERIDSYIKRMQNPTN